MNFLKSEKGNASIFFIGTLALSAIIFIIITNIGRAFVMDEQVSNVAEQAAIAGTNVLIEATTEAIEEYDDWFILEPDFDDLGLEKVGDKVDDEYQNYKNSGYSDNQAYIKALNSVLPSEINHRPMLKSYLHNYISNSSDQLYQSVISIIEANDGNYEDTSIVLSETDWRIEVDTTIRFNRVADGNYVMAGEHTIDRKGYGPELEYLEYLNEVFD